HDIGEGMTEGEILTYFVKVGDRIGVDEPLLEVQTDKMVAEIPSPVAGEVIAIHFQPGETITVGETIIEIDDGTKQTVLEQKEKKHSVGSEETVKKDHVPYRKDTTVFWLLPILEKLPAN